MFSVVQKKACELFLGCFFVICSSYTVCRLMILSWLISLLASIFCGPSVSFYYIFQQMERTAIGIYDFRESGCDVRVRFELIYANEIIESFLLKEEVGMLPRQFYTCYTRHA